MRIEHALKLRDEAVMSLKDNFASAKFYGPTSATMNEDYNKILARLQKAPEWVRAYLKGYRAALNDELYRESLVYGGWIGDKFYTTHSQRHDYYGLSMTPQDWLEKAERLGHYWKNPLKPFSVP